MKKSAKKYLGQSDMIGILNRMELDGLVREALAGMRCAKPDTALLERKLHEIALLDHLDAVDRMQACTALFFEIPANSDAGTKIIVDHLLFNLDEARMLPDKLARGDSQELLAEITSWLFEIAREALEYGRSEKIVESLVSALKTAAETALESGWSETALEIAEGMKELSGEARSERRAAPAKNLKSEAAKIEKKSGRLKAKE